MSSNGINPNNNVIKQEDIVNIWYQATGEKLGKVNLATNKEIDDATLAGKTEYMDLVKEKAIPLVYEKPITLKPSQDLHIVVHANTHNFDLSNPQLGVETRTNNLAFKKDLQDKKGSDKTIVFFTGNLIGKEWKISDLNNAAINDNKKILFWGLKNRLNQLVNDIKFAAKNGADQIFLMNGREEHIAKQKLNVDTYSEVLKEKFNDLLFDYIVKVLRRDMSLKDKRVEVSYVKGVKKIFNVVKTQRDKSTRNYTFSMHTNLKSTSDNMKSNKSAAIKQHAGLAYADAVFVQGENAAGVIDDDSNVAILTGQSTYNNAAKGNLPGYSPKGKSSLTLLLGENSHDVEIAWSCDFVNDSTYAVERKLAELREKEAYLAQKCIERIQEKRQEFAEEQSKVDFNRISKDIKAPEV